MKKLKFITSAFALALADYQFNLMDFIDNELLKEMRNMGKQKYLKRLASTFASFKKKQDKQKAKIKTGPHKHGVFTKKKSQYRKNRDIQIFKASKKLSINEIIQDIGNPFYSKQANVKYVEKCIKRGRKLLAQGA